MSDEGAAAEPVADEPAADDGPSEAVETAPVEGGESTETETDAPEPRRWKVKDGDNENEYTADELFDLLGGEEKIIRSAQIEKAARRKMSEISERRKALEQREADAQLLQQALADDPLGTLRAIVEHQGGSFDDLLMQEAGRYVDEQTLTEEERRYRQQDRELQRMRQADQERQRRAEQEQMAQREAQAKQGLTRFIGSGLDAIDAPAKSRGILTPLMAQEIGEYIKADMQGDPKAIAEAVRGDFEGMLVEYVEAIGADRAFELFGEALTDGLHKRAVDKLNASRGNGQTAPAAPAPRKRERRYDSMSDYWESRGLDPD